MKYVLVLLLVVSAFAQEKKNDTTNLYRLSGVAAQGSTVSDELVKTQMELNDALFQIAKRDARIAELESALESATKAGAASQSYISVRESHQSSVAPLQPTVFTYPWLTPAAPANNPFYCSAFTWGSSTSINCR